MNNADMPAAPTPIYDMNGEIQAVQTGNNEWQSLGFTKREKMAAMAMQGLISDSDVWRNNNNHELAEHAVEMADALLKALETKEEGQ